MSKELLFKIFNHETVERPAWVPFVGIHAGKLKNYNAIELLTDSNKLLESLLEANKLFRPDGQPVIFDLQVEAEILGCDLHWAIDTPPSVKSHPLQSTKKVPCLCNMPTEESGRLPMILETMRKMKQEVGDVTALYGLICGPFTLASHLRGTNIFMDMYDDPKYVKELLQYCTEVAKKMADMYIKAGMDIIAVVDPLISQISPKHFIEFMTENFTELFSFIKDNHAYSSFFVCGDATKNIDVMCQTNPDNISIDENIDIVESKKITDKYNIVLGGNIPLTTVMLHGSQQDNMKYTVNMIDSISSSNQNYIVSPGCDMPYATPIENTIGVSQAVLEFEETKNMVKNYESFDFSSIDVELPDYQKLDKPLIEAFTLDSDSCAACTYLWLMVTEVKEKFKDKIDIVEYKFTVKENIARVIKMGVTNLPSLYVNGKLMYSSIIPTKDELMIQIENFLK
ncbi:MAG: uroporphyrinogen decarboxylase [Bacilli bacterium]|nr:uroporphyrinogen decarboxylase [Bacilli bacterium]